MNWKLFRLAFALMFLTGLAASTSQNYNHEQKLYIGEQIEINEYVVEYKNRNSEQMFRIGRWTGTSFRIIEELNGVEIYESESDKVQISDNISLTIERTGYDENGRFIDLNISASKDVFSSGELTSSAPDRIIVSRGDSADIPLQLKNTGFLNQTYNLKAETNSSLATSFSFQSFNVSEVYVPAGEQESITAKVEVPEETRIGTYNLGLVAENYTSFSKEITVEVKGAEKDRELHLDVEQIYKEVKPGESIDFYVNIRNHGEAKLEDVNVTASAPDGWDLRLDDGYVEELRGRYGRERTKITVTAPQDANPGDYMMEINGESKRTSIQEPKEVRLHVKQKSGLAYIGAVLMAVSILILIIVYRKFQRR